MDFYSVLVEGDDPHEPIADSLRGLLDGHLVLSRDLAEEAVYPPIDILQSISRLQPKLIEKDVSEAVVTMRRYLADYRKHRDLIAIGAYRKGSDPQVDGAVVMNQLFRDYATQDWKQVSTLAQSQEMLLDLPRQLKLLMDEEKSTSVAKYDPIGTSVDL